jgi:hypothetical protein
VSLLSRSAWQDHQPQRRNLLNIQSTRSQQLLQNQPASTSIARSESSQWPEAVDDLNAANDGGSHQATPVRSSNRVGVSSYEGRKTVLDTKVQNTVALVCWGASAIWSLRLWSLSGTWSGHCVTGSVYVVNSRGPTYTVGERVNKTWISHVEVPECALRDHQLVSRVAYCSCASCCWLIT